MDGFTFKQFEVRHDKCAMKVGTDGVLLGAWADLSAARNIADVGCGSGLIALMAAQRSSTTITGIEIDAAAAAQAAENAEASPFGKRVSIIHSDIAAFTPPHRFDCVLSNPPFFNETTASPDTRRAAARHTGTLTYEALCDAAARLLLPGGLFQLIVPHAAAAALHALCALRGFSLMRRTDVRTKETKAPKRSLLCFVNAPTAAATVRDTLVLHTATGEKTTAYAALVADFYLSPIQPLSRHINKF